MMGLASIAMPFDCSSCFMCSVFLLFYRPLREHHLRNTMETVLRPYANGSHPVQQQRFQHIVCGTQDR